MPTLARYLPILLISAAVAGAALPAAAQCRTADAAVELKLTLGAAPSETLVAQRIPACVRHEYKLALRTGQRLELSLTSPSGQQGMLTLVAPSGAKPADGANAWSGAVSENGTYTIEVATDKTTSYTLRIVLR
jgi:hypothetical protein